ncbi:hypothetical protein ACFPK9_11925 [Rubritalea spongiae]|uniref:Uncharacterized protein n=1 Tax=Rubritalea spongiae TaxID=430797 RepID=A0ABW5E0J3_9BACT
MQKKSAASQPARQDDPSKYNIPSKPEESLLDRAQILGNGSTWTMVPKTSVLTVPERLKSKLLIAPKGKFVNWKTFLNSNPAWLGVEKVNLPTSSGVSKIDFERFTSINSKDKIIIAVLGNDPISVEPTAIEKVPPKTSK